MATNKRKYKRFRNAQAKEAREAILVKQRNWRSDWKRQLDPIMRQLMTPIMRQLITHEYIYSSQIMFSL